MPSMYLYSSGSHLPQALGSVLPLSFVYMPKVLSNMVPDSSEQRRQVRLSRSFIHSNLTYHSSPFPVQDSAGDIVQVRLKRSPYLLLLYCDQVDLPLLLFVSSAMC